MNYQRIYNQLVEKRTKECILEKNKELYTENHHIVPVCMNGSNEDVNIVRFTAREHFIAHLLLSKIFPQNYEIKAAVYCMSSIKRYNSKKYEKLKIGHNISRKQRGWISDETKQKISKSLKGRKRDPDLVKKSADGNRGSKRSEETKQKMSNSQKEYIKKNPMTDETKQKISNSVKEYIKHNPITDEAKQKISNTLKGRKKERLYCPFCSYNVGFPKCLEKHINKIHKENDNGQ